MPLLNGETAQELTVGEALSPPWLSRVVGFYLPNGGNIVYVNKNGVRRNIQGMTPGLVIRDPIRRLLSCTGQVWGVFLAQLREPITPPPAIVIFTYRTLPDGITLRCTADGSLRRILEA